MSIQSVLDLFSFESKRMEARMFINLLMQETNVLSAQTSFIMLILIQNACDFHHAQDRIIYLGVYHCHMTYVVMIT